VIIHRVFKHLGSPAGAALRAAGGFKCLCVAAIASAAAALSAGACAAMPEYNPGGLDAAQLTRVEDVCQNVMGLSATEPLTSGYWTGGERLDFWTSHYRGCVLSLSDTLNGVAHARSADAARQNCQAQGLKPDSPELALCMLRSLRQPSTQASGQVDAQFATPVSAQVPHVSKSFYSSSPRETAGREQVACAALGLEPATGTFTGCVRDLDGTLYAIDHPAQ
jgi:hypothetical protein